MNGDRRAAACLPASPRRPPARPHLPIPSWLLLATGLLGACLASPASAQLASPCEATCGAVLGATGFAFATGTLVAFGRQSGGVSNAGEVAAAWGGSFLLYIAGGLALGQNGERQERAVYAAGVGTLVGSLVGLGVDALLDDGGGARVVAAALVGAALGALAGGAYGALSWDGGATSPSMPLFQVSITH